jgi:LacI family transcriptional regulator
MSRSRIRHVALIIDASKPYDRKIIRGVGAYAREAGNWSLYVEENPVEKLPALRSWQGDGILASLDDARVAAAVRGLGTPVVGVGGGFGWYDPHGRIPYLATDSQGIARLAAEHLIQRGFTRLAYVGLPPTRINGWSRIRAAAFAQSAREAGMSCWTFVGRYGTARRWRELQEELGRWIAALPMPIGAMACNDSRARHVLEACRRLGVRVPEDLAVVGVDNDETIGELNDPSLSSVDQGAHRLGYRAAALLEQMMRGRRVSTRCIYVPPDRVVGRQSTDVLAIEDPEIASALRFIHQRAFEAIGVRHVVAAVSVSRSTLERQFSAAMHCTIREEIERVRLDRVKKLLADNELSIKEIAARAGFRHLTYLARVFRRRVGQTLAAYRRWLQSPALRPGAY